MNTTINPGRDVGPVHVHGITAGDVVHAPSFIEVAGDILERIAGKVWIGHNIRFDDTFLRSEYRRLGHELPPSPTVCTLQLSKTFVPKLQSHRLQNCCTHFGISLQEAHCALDDARATAKLFTTILGLSPGLPESIPPCNSDSCYKTSSHSTGKKRRLKVQKGAYIRSLFERPYHCRRGS
jgi:DNA polymerase-3 subunit epsilon